MPPLAIAVLLLLACYLAGAVPFGYLVARVKGVDLFKAGSGNIGATNVGRTLGRKYGVLVFALDFLKGAIPVASVVPAAEAIGPGVVSSIGGPNALRVGAATAAFVGHLFPVYLGFRGGKGVATGAGVVAVLVPGPALAAVAAWTVVALASRTVSLASLAAVGVLSAVRLIGEPRPFAPGEEVVTSFCLLGSLLVVAKHRANVGRLVRGTENKIGDGPMRQTLLRAVHVLALGFWFGGAGFFNFVVAPTHNATFKDVVRTAPNDRTAGLPLVPAGEPPETRDKLASALFGAAVGPVFPKYFAMQAACGAAALVTALAWWRTADGRRVHRRRVIVIGLAVLTVAIGWPLSNYVTDLRIARLSGDPAVAEAARAAFGPWHLASLGLSVVTVALAGVALAMAAFLPESKTATDEHRKSTDPAAN